MVMQRRVTVVVAHTTRPLIRYSTSAGSDMSRTVQYAYRTAAARTRSRLSSAENIEHPRPRRSWQRGD